MACTQVLEFNAAQQAWEARSHQTALGDLIDWHVAAVRDGAAEEHALYQASDAGNIYQVETGVDDAGVAISVLTLSKRYDLGAVSMLHDLYVRAEATVDTLSFEVRVGGSEYGEQARTYTKTLAGVDDKEGRIRLHRTLWGRWCSITWEGELSARPAIREMTLRYIPIREGRVSVSP